MQGHKASWLSGAADSMEARLVPKYGYEFNSVDFSGVRGKGVKTLALAPFRLPKRLPDAQSVAKSASACGARHGRLHHRAGWFDREINRYSDCVVE